MLTILDTQMLALQASQVLQSVEPGQVTQVGQQPTGQQTSYLVLKKHVPGKTITTTKFTFLHQPKQEL